MRTEFPISLFLPDTPPAPPPPHVEAIPGRIGAALGRVLSHLDAEDHQGRSNIGKHLAQVAAFHQQQLNMDNNTAGNLQ